MQFNNKPSIKRYLTYFSTLNIHKCIILYITQSTKKKKCMLITLINVWVETQLLWVLL